MKTDYNVNDYMKLLMGLESGSVTKPQVLKLRLFIIILLVHN